MPYVIDGHNLIPKVPGIDLSNIDDEMQLVKLLQEFCQHKRKTVEVFFDNAPPGQRRARKFGAVTAYFTREGRTADDAINARLKRLGRSARNWTVVSSDQAVQRAARAVKSKVVFSEDFVQELLSLEKGDQSFLKDPEVPLSSEEVDDWLDVFGGDKEGDE